jgi:hypothetical protein
MKPHILSPTSGVVANPGTLPLSQRKVLAPATLPSSPNSRVTVGADAGHSRQPQVTVQKQGDEVTAIEVVCGCGEKITIELKY